MKHVQTIDQRRTQLEQLWHDDRSEFLSEYCRIIGKPANDPTLSLKSITNQMINQEMATHVPVTLKPR